MCLPCCRLKQPTAPKVPTILPFSAARKALRAVLDDRQVPGCGRADRRHFARIAEQVRHDDRLRPIAQAGGDGRGGNVAGQRIDIGEHRDRPLIEDRGQRPMSVIEVVMISSPGSGRWRRRRHARRPIRRPAPPRTGRRASRRSAFRAWRRPSPWCRSACRSRSPPRQFGRQLLRSQRPAAGLLVGAGR